ncbi:hypothetical protein AYK24_04435 [Thermoplasmatales archaeon SG8-52-4]|nr:MAG: hypothetical protein AYK24_04435 [Thermoplasmatales archaeon SG8-52-4]
MKNIPLALNGLKFICEYEAINQKCNFEKSSFSQPKIICKDQDSLIKYIEELTNTWEISKQKSSVVKKIFFIQFETQVINALVTLLDYFKKNNNKQIKPAPNSHVLSTDIINQNIVLESDSLYEKNKSYPKQRFTYIIGMGLKGEELLSYLLVYQYPVHYRPKKILYIVLVAKHAM